MRYFLGFLGIVALIVVVVILIVRGFGGGGSSNVQSQLTDYADTQTVMRMIVNGPVNADQDHQSLYVTVGRDSSSIKVFQGYQRSTVLQSQSYTSNDVAYGTFLRALQLQGYTKGNPDPSKADSRGECPLGKVYRFQILTGSGAVQDFWTTSCGGGTFKGNAAMIRDLFKAQIPDYFDLAGKLGLS